MSGRPELWIPGPTEVRAEILAELARPMIGHRTAEMEATIASLDPGLRALFGAEEEHEVAVHSVTATGLMELGLRAVGPRVLCVVNGSFSRRFAEVARALGKEVEVVETPLGTGADLQAARERLGAGEPFDAVTVCASETSSGVLTAPSEIGALLTPEARRGAWLLVDAVTLLGAGPLDVGRHGIDLALAGTQKALALPPGLGLFAVSRAMLEAAPAGGSYFLDARRIVETHRARKPPMTPTIPLLRALEAQLSAIADGGLEARLDPDGPPAATGWEQRFARHAAMSARTRRFAAETEGVRVFGADGVATSPAVTALEVDGGGVPELLAGMAEDGFRIGAGYGELKTTCVRIGHMGDHRPARLDALLESLAARLQGA